jgi:hypothetical protein
MAVQCKSSFPQTFSDCAKEYTSQDSLHLHLSPQSIRPNWMRPVFYFYNIYSLYLPELFFQFFYMKY